jgi:hypothetical protein
VYVSDEDFSYLFETNVRRYAGTTKQWLEAGGDIDLPKTIGFQVGIYYYVIVSIIVHIFNYLRLNAM